MQVIMFLAAMMVSDAEVQEALRAAALSNKIGEVKACITEYAAKIAVRTNESASATGSLAVRFCASKIGEAYEGAHDRGLLMDAMQKYGELQATRCRIGELDAAICPK
ncbi:hypothetical protein G8E10_09435 [Rhizobiaceae bacterium CRRU44]|uniref:Uncharacterized protein n=1 Tax=Ferranicluibacter rubi TaxID=2715133 RepID=A0AA43ZGF3_9HYPH|nr:hypothetical protein [Ferranicluibacter rubi]NHT75901.1 hypothetical protein [Ferranicluibacter rubi]NHT75961.1 hypothetical protein [Ferranicluibacter rubi]